MRLVPIACALLAPLAAALGVACGSSNSSTNQATSTEAGADTSTPVEDAGTVEAAVEAAPYPAFVPANVPQVVSRGGPIMPLPKVVPIFYATDDTTTTASIQSFVNALGASDYWHGALAEYGVGQVVGETAIQLTSSDDPPTTYDDSDIEAWLANKLQSADPAFPAPDANTIYAFFFPAGIKITTGGTSSGWPDGEAPEGGGGGGGGGGQVSTSCVDFGGYHSVIQLANGTPVTYAVVPRCANFDGFTGVDAVTAAASHEIAESSTDPLVQLDAAYLSTDSAHRYWATILGGGEVGDMCAQNLGSFVKFPDLPYTVQRIWSNKAAVAGTDPCTPVPTGEVYFNSIPILPDTLNVTGRGADGGTTTVATQAVQIAVGSSKTIELDLFSSAPTPSEWQVQAADEYDLQLASSQQLKFSYDKTTGQNGDKIQLTITVVAAGSKNQEPFIVYSTMKSTQAQNLWVGLVGQ